VGDARSLLLLRHGQTAWNLERRIQGHLDAGLDETGHAQARAAATVIAPHRPALLWSSDLSRARGTAAYVGEACGLEVVTDPRLREYHLGSMEGRTYADVAETDPEAFARFRTGDFEAGDGESTAEVGDRVAEALRELLDATPAGRVSVAVSHGAAIRVGLAEAMGWGAPVGLTLGGLGNCSWAVLTERQRGGPLRLNSYNREAPADDDQADFASPPSVG
jgi:glucosyl-3-phosphoglycerate phosphatase